MADEHDFSDTFRDDIRRDDRLLEAVARGGLVDSVDLADPAAGPLLALARVGGEAPPPTLDPDLLLAAAEDRRGRRYAVRSLAVAVTVVATLSTTGVAAVVTGDPFHPAKAVWQHLRGDSRVVAPGDGDVLGSAHVPGLRARGSQAPPSRSRGGDAGGGGTGEVRLEAALPTLLGRDGRARLALAAAPAGPGAAGDSGGPTVGAAGRGPSAREQDRGEDAAGERSAAEAGRSTAGSEGSAGSGETEDGAVPGTEPEAPAAGSEDDRSGDEDAADEAEQGSTEDEDGGVEDGGVEDGDGGVEDGDGGVEEGDDVDEPDPDPDAGLAPGAPGGVYPVLGDQAPPPAAPSGLVSPAPR